MAVKPDTAVAGTGNSDKPAAGVQGNAEAEVSNETLLAELRAERAKGEGGKPAKIAPAADDEDDDGEDNSADDDADDANEDEDDEAVDADGGDDDDDDDDDDEEEADDEDRVEDEDEDPETAKRMAALRRTEQRQRQALDRDRATFEREKSDFEAQRKDLTQSKERFDQLAARVKYDSYSVLKALGVPDDDLEYHAQQLVANSPKYAAKPEYRAAAAAAMKERERADDTSRALTRVEELEKKIKERDDQAAIARDTEVYMARLARRVGEESPLVKSQLAKNPAEARKGLAIVALEIAQKKGQLPKSKVVVAVYEKRLAKRLAELGIESPTGKSAAATAKGDGAATAANKPTGKKVGGKSAAAKAKADTDANGAVYHPSYDELLEEIRAGEHLE